MQLNLEKTVFSEPPSPGAKKITELTFSYYRNDYDTDESGNRLRVPTLHTRIREVQSASHNKRTLNFIIDFSVVLILAYFLVLIIKGIFQYFDSYLIFILSFSVLFFLYYVLLEYKFQQTIGKFLTHTILIDEYARKPSLKQVFWRTFYRIPDLRYLNFYFREYMDGTDYCRGKHDRNTNTWVVPVEEYENLKKLIREESNNVDNV